VRTDNILDLIGNTPLMRLKGENIFAKPEFLNPGGSIKDRVALAMIQGAERDGRLRPGSIIVEPTSGNTGIGVALVGRLKGYKVRIVMPQGMSEERKKIIRALGADLVLCAKWQPRTLGSLCRSSLRTATIPAAITRAPQRSCGGRWTAILLVSSRASAAAVRCRA
jgi:cysteine synthase